MCMCNLISKIGNLKATPGGPQDSSVYVYSITRLFYSHEQLCLTIGSLLRVGNLTTDPQ